MFKRETIGIFCLLLVACLGLVVLINLRSLTLKGRILPGLGYFFAIITPPDDIYIPKVLGPIDFTQEGKVFTYYFTNKYVGEHHMGLFVEKVPSMTLNLEPADCGKLRVRFYYEGRSILEKEVMKTWQWFFSGADHSGAELMAYMCPRDLPIDKEIKCEITVERGNPDFVKKYGNARLRVMNVTSL